MRSSITGHSITGHSTTGDSIIDHSLGTSHGVCFDPVLHQWPDPVVIVDSGGRVAGVSAAARQVLGWRDDYAEPIFAHEKLCAPVRGHMHAADNCPFQRSMDYSEWQSELWCLESGEYRSVDVRATDLQAEFSRYTAWSFVDNAERVHNQAEFEKLAQFVDLSPGPMAEFDAQGQILFANSAMQALMVSAGFDASGQSEVLPSDLSDVCTFFLTPSRSSECIEGSNSRVVAVGERFLRWHFLSLEGNAGVPATLLAFAFDVTDQQRAAEALEEAKRSARRDFYAKMIHELRTPLNAIIGFSDLLLARAQVKLSERECKNLQAIKNAGFQLNELVTDTLDISKIEAGFMGLDIEEFDLSALCSTFLAQIEALAVAKNLAFEVHQPTSIVVRSDRQKVRQVLINLLSNAIKYTREGGVTLTLACGDGSVELSVSDTGIGIPDAQKHKLFNQYSQIDEAQNTGISGTGLGLALVGELVKMLQGEIAVRSEYGKGSEFVVKLPLQYQA